MHLFADGAVVGIVYAAHLLLVIIRYRNEVGTTGRIVPMALFRFAVLLT